MALDLDLACSYELTRHENERDSKRLKELVKSIGVIMLGEDFLDAFEDD